MNINHKLDNGSAMDLTRSTVTQLIAHRIGNKLRDEALILSNSTSPTSQTLSSMLLGGYLNKISIDQNLYSFSHETEISLNAIRYYSKEFFSSNTTFIEASKNFARQLYEISVHPNIKTGDLIVILFENIEHNNHLRRGLGLFKSEAHENYLTITEHSGKLSINSATGISPSLIDKGALILEDTDAVFAVDSLRSRSKFWIDDFLKVKKFPDPVTSKKMMAFVANQITEAIDSPLDRLRYNETLSKLCVGRDVIELDDISTATDSFVSKDDFNNAVAKAQRRFGFSTSDGVATTSNQFSRNINGKMTKLLLNHGMSLILPKDVSVVNYLETENANHEINISVLVRFPSER